MSPAVRLVALALAAAIAVNLIALVPVIGAPNSNSSAPSTLRTDRPRGPALEQLPSPGRVDRARDCTNGQALLNAFHGHATLPTQPCREGKGR